MNILIVEDQIEIASLLQRYLRKEGYEVTIAQDGEAGLDAFYKDTFELVLLDIMLPKMDGMEVCRQIRKSSHIPIMMISAKGDDYDKIMGLDNGADDYIVKPFSVKELLARIRSLMRRMHVVEKKQRCEFETLSIDMETFQTRIDGHIVELSKKEQELLYVFASNPNQVFTRESLLEQVWGMDYDGDFRTVDTHIKRLRKKIEPLAAGNFTITTVWGVGYRFETTSH
ncbi:MAG: response regulator transcription factor [Erysipelotrichaceae bacterium]